MFDDAEKSKRKRKTFKRRIDKTGRFNGKLKVVESLQTIHQISLLMIIETDKVKVKMTGSTMITEADKVEVKMTGLTTNETGSTTTDFISPGLDQDFEETLIHQEVFIDLVQGLLQEEEI